MSVLIPVRPNSILTGMPILRPSEGRADGKPRRSVKRESTIPGEGTMRKIPFKLETADDSESRTKVV